MDQWMQFAQEQWYVLVLGLIAVVLIIKVVKAVVKWVLILAIVIGIGYYAMNYTDTIMNVGSQVIDYAKEQAYEAMAAEASKAKYAAESDGTYTIQSSNLIVRGQVGSDEVEITLKGQSFTLKINEAIQVYIDHARKNSTA
jgi:hypothetical protein